MSGSLELERASHSQSCRPLGESYFGEISEIFIAENVGKIF